MRTRIKICGITRPEDLATAVAAGADAIGMVFYPGSPRYIDLARAAALRRAVPAFVDAVALFVNPEPAWVEQVIEAVAPDLLQFHGDEAPADCERYGRRYLRAFRVGAPGMDSAAGLLAACQGFRSAAGWMFDSYSPAYGGSGKTFEHALLADVMAAPDARPVILSGGLTAATLPAVLQTLHPYGVDVSSGVEVSAGIKSAEKIQGFVQAVMASDRARFN
jgi:phosphoribosylanthranilate isomerase